MKVNKIKTKIERANNNNNNNNNNNKLDLVGDFHTMHNVET